MTDYYKHLLTVAALVLCLIDGNQYQQVPRLLVAERVSAAAAERHSAIAAAAAAGAAGGGGAVRRGVAITLIRLISTQLTEEAAKNCKQMI